MDFNVNKKSIREQIKQLKDYRDSVEFYNTNKEAFVRQENSIQLEDNVAFISPLNDIDKHLEEENVKKLLLINNSKGLITFNYVVYGILIFLLIILVMLMIFFIRGV